MSAMITCTSGNNSDSHRGGSNKMDRPPALTTAATAVAAMATMSVAERAVYAAVCYASLDSSNSGSRDNEGNNVSASAGTLFLLGLDTTSDSPMVAEPAGWLLIKPPRAIGLHLTARGPARRGSP